MRCTVGLPDVNSCRIGLGSIVGIEIGLLIDSNLCADDLICAGHILLVNIQLCFGSLRIAYSELCRGSACCGIVCNEAVLPVIIGNSAGMTAGNRSYAVGGHSKLYCGRSYLIGLAFIGEFIACLDKNIISVRQ